MYTVSPQGIVSLDGKVLTLSLPDEARFQTQVVTRWGALAQSLARGIPLAWLLSIIWAESGGNPDAFRTEPSGQTGVGLMQITAPVLKGGLSDAQLKDPKTNIEKGVAALLWISKFPPVDLPSVASRYNCGSAKDGSPHRSPTSGQNPSWGLCATAGYLERVSAANNVFLRTAVTQPAQARATPSLVGPALAAVGAALVVRRLLR